MSHTPKLVALLALCGCSSEALVTACADGPDAAVHDKRLLLGEDMVDVVDDPLFVSRAEVIEGSPTFPVGQRDADGEVRFEMARDFVSARLASSPDDLIAVLPVTLHARDHCGEDAYGRSLGCLITEVECSFPWYETRWFSADWSRNLATWVYRFGLDDDAEEPTFELRPDDGDATIGLEQGRIALTFGLAAIWSDRSEQILVRHTFDRIEP
jgi:hypothetical protein